MWIREHDKVFEGLSKEAAWSVWTDVNNWGEWHNDLDHCKMEGDFVVGNHFMLKPTGAKAVKIDLIEITPGVSFTDCTSFPGAKMYDTHILKEVDGGLLLKNKIVVTGPLKWLWVKIVAEHVAKTVPDDLERFVSLARTKM